MVLVSQPTKSVLRRVRLAIERNIDEMCPKRIPKLKMQHENPDVKHVETTRPLRGVLLFDETCDLNVFSRKSFWSSKRSTGAKGVPGSDGISDKRGPGPGWNLVFPP